MPPNSAASDDRVLTLKDLEGWNTARPSLAVIGSPIKHSVSPAMHNAALREMAASDDSYGSWHYYKFEVPPEQLEDALPRFHRAGFIGLNLTVPHKILAFTRVAAVDTAAQPIGAVNTLKRADEGWHAFNTDGHGLAAAMRETLGASLTGAHVLLLGAGGAARGAAVECLQRGCASLTIANRTAATREALVRDLAPLSSRTQLRSYDPSALPADLPQGLWIINATSAGLKPDDPSPIDLAQVRSPAGVYDMIYNPPATPLLRQAASLGINTANGLSMLVHQGARALEIWTGRSVPVGTMLRAAEDALRK